MPFVFWAQVLHATNPVVEIKVKAWWCFRHINLMAIKKARSPSDLQRKANGPKADEPRSIVSGLQVTDKNHLLHCSVRVKIVSISARSCSSYTLYSTRFNVIPNNRSVGVSNLNSRPHFAQRLTFINSSCFVFVWTISTSAQLIQRRING